MYTWQDLEKLNNDEEKRKEFVLSAIMDHERSDLYKWAVDADLYMRQLNSTIMKYRKTLNTISGNTVIDEYAANHKTASNYLKRFVTQEYQYVLENGILFDSDATKESLGGDSFDIAVQDAGRESLVGAVSFGFWNYDHLEMFKVQEFAPLWDEETGALKAGVRFWQLDKYKPLRVTLYELDGYTDYIRGDNGMETLEEKRPYIQNISISQANGIEKIEGENYPGFPIVPFWGNPEHQSELVGLKTEIDAYDLIKSGMCNDLDDVSSVYWLIHNAGGMDERDLATFLDQIKRLKAAIVTDDTPVDAHTMEVPYQSRETYLQRLENDMYHDAMALNTKEITAGNITATAIKAAYNDLDHKCGEFWKECKKFITGIMEIAGVSDSFHYKKSQISNDAETTQNVLAAAQYLDNETILRKLPFIDDEEIPDILERLAAEQVDRYVETGRSEEEDRQEVGEVGEEAGGGLQDSRNRNP